MAGLHPLCPGHAGRRPGRLSPQGACGQYARGGRVERSVDRPGADVQHRCLLVHGPPGRSGISDRLPHREGPVRRQHLRVRLDLLLLWRAAAVPAPRPVLGDPGGPGDARGHDRRRGLPDLPVPLDHLRLRGLPGVHRPAHGHPERAGHRAGSQPRRAPGAPRVAGDERLPRAALLYPRGGRAEWGDGGWWPRRCSSSWPW